MNANIQTNTKPFIVYRDGEVDKELSTLEPHSSPITALKNNVDAFKHYISLQAEMAVYDALHGTDYRKLRNYIVRQQRNAAFEAKIGLVRTK